MRAAAVTAPLAARVAGHETAERRRRLGLTRHALARASGIAAARLSAHEDGRVALDAQELGVVDAVFSPRETELGLPSVRPDYVPADGAAAERDEEIRRDVLCILFAPGTARGTATEGSPGAQKEGVAPRTATPSDVQTPDHEASACLSPF